MADELLSAIDEAIQNGVTEIGTVKNASVETVNETKDEALSELDTAKNNHLTTMTNHKNTLEASLTTTKELALNELGTVKSMAIDEIDEYANEITTQQNQAITSMTHIKDTAILDVDLERDMALSSINAQVLYLQNFRNELETKGAKVLSDIDLGIDDIEIELINALTNIGIDKGLALQAIADLKTNTLNNINSKLTELNNKQTEVLTSANTAKTDAIGAITNERNITLAEIQEDLLTLDQIRYDLETQRLAIVNDGVINEIVNKGEEAKRQADNAKNYAAIAKVNGDFANSKGLYANEQGNFAKQKANEANNATINANSKASIAQEKATLADNKAKLAQDKADLVDAKLWEHRKLIEEQKINYLEPVDTYSDINMKYKNPKLGDSVQTLVDGKKYRWNGISWILYEQIVNVQGSKLFINDSKPSDQTVLWVDTSI